MIQSFLTCFKKDTAYKLYPFERDAQFTYDATNNGWYFNSLKFYI